MCVCACACGYAGAGAGAQQDQKQSTRNNQPSSLAWRNARERLNKWIGGFGVFGGFGGQEGWGVGGWGGGGGSELNPNFQGPGPERFNFVILEKYSILLF